MSEPTGGTFVLTSGEHATAPLPHDASAEEIRAALDALPPVGGGPLFPRNRPGWQPARAKARLEQG